MKCVILLYLIALALVIAPAHGGACIYDPWGRCMRDCPPGTVSFVSPCGAPPGTTYKRGTCSSPLRRDVSGICDMSWCGCADENLFWDDVQGACVKLEDCAKTVDTKTGEEGVKV